MPSQHSKSLNAFNLFDSVSVQSQPHFNVFSSGKELQIQPSLPDSKYEVEVFDLSGKCVYRDQKSGSQNLPVDYSKGIYMVVLTQENFRYQTKIYVEQERRT